MRVLQIGWRGRATKGMFENGHRVTVVASFAQKDWGLDREEFAENVILVENLKDCEHVLFSLHEQSNNILFDAVVAFDEFNLLMAHQIANSLGVNFYDYPLISRMRSKYLQKKHIKDFDIKCATTHLIIDIREVRSDFPFPFVIKPVSGAGTVNTFIVRNEKERNQIFDRLVKSSSRTFLIESLQEGAEYHFDGWVIDGKLCFLNCGRYLNNSIEIQSGHTLASISTLNTESSEFHEKSRKFLEQALKALNYTNGCFHLEAFYHKDEWTFSEMGMRVGGAGIPLYFEKHLGVDLFKISSEIFLKDNLSLINKNNTEISGWVNIPCRSGKITSIPKKEDFQKLAGVKAVEIELEEGYSFPGIEHASFVKLGTAVITGNSKEEFKENVDNLLKWASENTEVTRQ